MTILDKIIASKRLEVEEAKKVVSLAELRKHILYSASPLSLKKNLLAAESNGVIAEFKRRSPSKGMIHKNADVSKIVNGYKKAGVAGVSVLTDQNFFGAQKTDFSIATSVAVPLLRKEFIIDEYQVEETKAMGACVMLLIAACLSKKEIQFLSALANNIGLEVLLELHGEEEIEKICDTVDFVGVNNRNLHTFEVDLKQTMHMGAMLSKDYLLIAESGITDPKSIAQFRDAGFKGFLIGEKFMKENEPAQACQNFIKRSQEIAD